MRLLDRIAKPRSQTRSAYPLGLESLFYNGHGYGLFAGGSYGKEERVRLTLDDVIRSNGVVFGVVSRRADMFSQVRFGYIDKTVQGLPTRTDIDTGHPSLAELREPADLLWRMELDVASHGAAYPARINRQGPIRLLHPPWLTLVAGSEMDPRDPAAAIDAEIIGGIYKPPEGDPQFLSVDEFSVFAPYPDPGARWRGMSYLEPVLADASVDNQAREFVHKFYQQGATPNTYVSLDPTVTLETAKAFQEMFNEEHAGVANAFRTAFLGGGAKPHVVGTKLSELDSQNITRQLHAAIAVASGVPAIIAGVIPGLESSTYSNYGMAFRSFADITVRPLWAAAATALGRLVNGPARKSLWYDVSHVAAMQDDARDDAEIQSSNAATMRSLVDGGFDPDTVIDAVVTGDLSKLIHTGKLSVQLQDPEDDPDPELDPAPAFPALPPAEGDPEDD